MITVLGASGFIGTHLVRYLREAAIPHRTPARGERLAEGHLDHVIDCAGITADFRGRTLATVDAHVSRILDLARNCTFDSFLYLSSTRVYRHHRADVAHEDDCLTVRPTDPDDLYTLSKLMGESVVLGSAKGRVVRLSNVHGPGASTTFLAHILEDVRTRGAIELETSLDSAKDYVSIDDVVPLLTKIALQGTQRVYNVASGSNLTNRELTAEIARITGCSITVRPNAPTIRFPRIDITRIRDEFGFEPSPMRLEVPA
jgi:nucleoside-diphosphate-sugar epimerase